MTRLIAALLVLAIGACEHAHRVTESPHAAKLSNPPEDEPCAWRVYCHPSHYLTYEVDSAKGPCDQPLVYNMRHHPTDPCLFKIVFGAKATHFEDRQHSFPIGDCNAPLVIPVS